MRRSNFSHLKLTNFFSITLKTVVLIFGLNIILTTIFVLIKDQIQENYPKEISCLYLKRIRSNLKNLS